ncbi:lipoprotein [Bordetella pertussis]|nr:lipoprotein [Bordetella pertussis]
MVENRPGAATIIGATAIAQADPAGYVVGTADSGTLAFNPSLYAKLSYDPAKFTYIGGIRPVPADAGGERELAVQIGGRRAAGGPQEPAKPDCRLGRRRSPHHLALELFKQRANVDVLHVPYKGAARPSRTCWAGRWT